MNRWPTVVLIASMFLGNLGCGDGNAPAPKELTADEEKAFERQQEEDRRGESRIHE